MLYTVRVTEHIEREVIVEAVGPHMARLAASRRADWLDAGLGVTIGIDVEQVTPHVSEVDAMQAWKEHEER